MKRETLRSCVITQRHKSWAYTWLIQLCKGLLDGRKKTEGLKFEGASNRHKKDRFETSYIAMIIEIY